MVRASALKSDYVLMDPGSNPTSASFSLKMKKIVITPWFKTMAEW